MARFLLVHGSCHGAWCWRDVLTLLRAAGHEAQAIDLPARGQDRTPLAEATLDLYARAILEALPEGGVLVGHSMAGFPITAAAELAPERIGALIYVCAYVPVSGKSLAQMRREGPRQPLRDAIVTAADRQSFTIDTAKAREKFYHDCPDEAVAYAVPRLCAEPVRPQETALEVTKRSTGVRRHYILCEDDRTIPPEYQAVMSASFPPSCVSRLPTSHSPFLSAPASLAQRLIDISEAP